MKKVKKRRLKKTPILILIIILILISSSIGLTINKKGNKKNTKTKTELKLEKLNHIEKKLSYFNYNNLDRYIKYKKDNPKLSNKQIIIDVNIGLDYEYYTHTKESINLNKPTILVNKYNYLTENYIPENLEKINTKYAKEGMQLVNYAKDAFEEMAKAAEKDGYKIIAMSSYRSYKYQVNLYNRYKENDGQEAADTYSARPGFSEHQTGLATDIYNGKIDFNNFEETEEFTWMQDNAYKYGFILRFPKDKTKQTGYQYESWHYRYVGKEIAKYIHKNNLCLEEYYIQKIENN
ncbi:MAG: D-alanyl-D-alanine carboxypeptidase family protein [Firmicutes bacterium]|nr:D-alanyl-D-alanine carboxypeptidase family protein [Bacillota bacterium]